MSDSERVAALQAIIYDLNASFECYAAHHKPESEWDEYDHMMFPRWRRAVKALEGYVPPPEIARAEDTNGSRNISKSEEA